jgi:hypothetical protein
VKGNHPHALVGHSATFLNNQIYVLGSLETNQYLNVWTIDPSTRTFVSLENLKLFDNNKIKTFSTLTLKSFCDFLVSFEWKQIQTRHSPKFRTFHKVVASDHILFVFGGTDERKQELFDFWSFNTSMIYCYCYCYCYYYY